MNTLLDCDPDMLRAAGINEQDAKELVDRLSILANDWNAKSKAQALNEAQSAAELWAQHLPLLLQQLVKDGVDVPAIQGLLSQSVLESNSTTNLDKIIENLSHQRNQITKSVEGILDVQALERQFRALVKREKCNGTVQMDGILSVVAKEEQHNV